MTVPFIDAVTLAAGRIAARYAACLRLDQEWQALETALAVRARALGLTLIQGLRSGLHEARALRRLDKARRRKRKALRGALEALCLITPETLDGIISKIHPALMLLAPEDLRAIEWRLLASAAADLRTLGFAGPLGDTLPH